jgi:putative ribosome biogenesis GTPase RsgA
LREPDCAVRGALEEGLINAERFRSYETLLEELRAAPKEWE